jgi:hypothetical protein
MSNVDFKAALWERITDEIRPIHKHGLSQLSVRCPFCGDSSKHTESTHFYVKINMKEDEPVLFNCFLCGTSGIMTPSVLRSLQINDLGINSALLTYNKVAMKNMKYQLGIFDNNLELEVPVADENDERNLYKKRYFDGRLNIKTTFEELAELKVIFKLGQFLKHNEIEKITSPKDKAIMLNNDYLGFLTTRNEFINFRQVYTDNRGKRYDKYNVFNNLDNTRKFYTVPNQVDLLSTKRITLNISEGAFDILGIYYHLYEKEKENMIYSAVLGSGYVNVIKYFIKMGVFGNVDVNIYSDNDKSPRYYKPIIKELKPWVDNFTLYYNDKSHDFGVPKDKIKVIKKRV